MDYLFRMDVFEVLADPVRRSLLRELRSGPSRVVDLAATQQVSRPAISRHLRLLGEVGLVEAADRGRERHYALRVAGLGAVDELLSTLRMVAPPQPHPLDALDTEVRRTSRERRRTSTPADKETA